MLQSKLFYKTTKNKSANAESVSHDLLTRAGYIDQLMAGVYSFLPLGFRVLKNIEDIIRKNMEAIGGQEILMPSLISKESWQKTGRWEGVDVLFKLKGLGEKEYGLGFSHEEVVAPLAKKIVFSYRDLPFSIFQIQNKFRNELRAKSGILRTREFLMKDLYSFHANQEDFKNYYEKAAKAYEKIFREVGIGKITHRTLAGGGSFSKYSDEFQTITDAGEDLIYICKKCVASINKEIKSEYPSCPKCQSAEFEEKKAIEVGNIFPLGTKFSTPFDLKFTDRDGHDKPVLMGCYGIGLGRLMGAIAETSHDNRGIIWPKNVAPFKAHIIEINPESGSPSKKEKENIEKLARKIYNLLQEENISVLWDDRKNKSAGEKFAESDLLGIPYRIVVSRKTIKDNSFEVKKRESETGRPMKARALIKLINDK